MKILEKLQKLHFVVAADNVNGNPNANPPEPPGTLGKRVSNAAVAALTNGIHSNEWKQYMSLFADNTAQLERLTVPNPNTDPAYLPLMRAYIVSNAICDIGTPAHTANRIDERIDQDLEATADGTVDAIRPFVITGL